mgnify:CR=1 FL=1
MRLVAVIIFFFSLAAFAETNVNFEDTKKKALEGVEKRITQLQSLKSCMSSSKDQKGLRECRKNNKMDNMRRRRAHMEGKMQGQESRANRRKARMKNKAERMDKKMEKMKDEE